MAGIESAELKKLVKELQTAGNSEATVNVLKILKKSVVANEALLRETKAGLAVGKLRSHASKEVADLAKELVRKWKAEVDKAKQANGGSGGATASASTGGGTKPKLTPLRKPSLASTSTSNTPSNTNAASSPKPPNTPTALSPSAYKGLIRTAKSDNVAIDTGDSVRDKCVELIYDSLAGDSGAPNDLILKRAKTIESHVLSDFSGSTAKDYKAKIRSLYLNLKDKNNPALRESIISGDLEAGKLTKMSSQDMASEERKAADRAIQEQNLHNSLGAGEQQAETDAFQCGRCKQRKTRYRQAQTRSADEPMTTFVTCVVCNFRWKFS